MMRILRIAAMLLLIMGAAFAGAALKVKTFVEPKPQTIKESISLRRTPEQLTSF